MKNARPRPRRDNSPACNSRNHKLVFGCFRDTASGWGYKNLRLLPWSPNFAIPRSRLATRRRAYSHRRIELLHDRQTRELDMTIPCKSARPIESEKPIVYIQKMTIRGNGMLPARITLIKRSSIVLFAYLGAMITGINRVNNRLGNVIRSQY